MKKLLTLLLLVTSFSAFAQLNTNATLTKNYSEVTYENIKFHSIELVGKDNHTMIISSINIQCDAFQKLMDIYLTDDVDMDILNEGKKLLRYPGYETYMVTLSETHIDWSLLLQYYKMEIAAKNSY